jgi:DNA modification methylase
MTDTPLLLLGDCLDIIPTLPKVSAVIADIPYGTTRCSWDCIIPFDEMWKALATVTSRGTPVVLFGTEPFSSHLRLSNIKQFKYDWVWDKPKGTGFLNAKKQPLRNHEMISVFGEGQVSYYPQKTQGHKRRKSVRKEHLQTEVYGHMANDYHYDSTERYPRSVQTFSSDTQNSSLHRTQKPLDLMRYLVRTYSQPGETILDFTMGSGTTGVACLHEGRRFIGIEKDPSIFDIAKSRIDRELVLLDS